jgi:hypothetical protein
MSDELVQISSTDEEASAEALAEMLRNEGVPAVVHVISPVPGIIEEVQVHVPGSLAHRARWFINTSKVSDAELRFAATGELSQDEVEN